MWRNTKLPVSLNLLISQWSNCNHSSNHCRDLQFPHSERTEKKSQATFLPLYRHDLANFKTSWLFDLPVFGVTPENTPAPYKPWLFWREEWEPLRKEEATGYKSPHVKEQGTETTWERRSNSEEAGKNHITTDSRDQSDISSSHFSPFHQL